MMNTATTMNVSRRIFVLARCNVTVPDLRNRTSPLQDFLREPGNNILHLKISYTVGMRFLVLLSFAATLRLDNAESIWMCDSCPPNFPKTIPLSQMDFQNNAGNMLVKNLWTAIVRMPSDVAILANWAKEKNYTIRPRGKMHGWSPLSVTLTTDCRNTLMVDTTKHLTRMAVYPEGIEHYSFPVVYAEAGVTLDNLLAELESHNYGFTASAAMGNLTIGGLFAIGGHGFAISTPTSLKWLKNYGSVVNRIVKIEAVTWSEELNIYALKTFDRSDFEVSALMTHLGMAFVTSVMLRVEQNFNLSCATLNDIPDKELYADANTPEIARTASSFLEATGRTMVMTYPFQQNSFILDCKEVMSCPEMSEILVEPYSMLNAGYQTREFLKILLQPMTNFLEEFLVSLPFDIIQSMNFKRSGHFCGLSKNLLLYMQASNVTGHETLLAYAVLTKRQNMQQVFHMVKTKLDSLVENFKSIWNFVPNGYFEFRVTELDDPNDIGPNARSSFLAPTSKSAKYPEFDIVLWLEFLSTNIDVITSNAFFYELESYFLSAFNGTLGICRPEWSKAWAFTDKGPWTNDTIMHDIIANNFDDWDNFIIVTNQLDPHNIYRNEFLDALFAPRITSTY